MILRILGLVGTFAAGFALAAAVANAVDVQMTPAACYSMQAMQEVDEKHGIAGYALIFNACKPHFGWMKVPLPPGGEV